MNIYMLNSYPNIVVDLNHYSFSMASTCLARVALVYMCVCIYIYIYMYVCVYCNNPKMKGQLEQIERANKIEIKTWALRASHATYFELFYSFKN